VPSKNRKNPALDPYSHYAILALNNSESIFLSGWGHWSGGSIEKFRARSGYLFHARSAQNFSFKVRLKKFIQGPVDPETIFNRDPARDEKFSCKVRLKMPGTANSSSRGVC
jgi:hypothetical protein